MDVLRDLADRARRDRRRIVLPEGHDPRVREAAAQLSAQGVCEPVEIRQHLRRRGAEHGLLGAVDEDRLQPHAGRGEDVPVEPRADVDDDLPFRVGAKLRHARWGEGLLVGIQREGADVIATVHFASVGRKRLSLQYAHLEEL